MSGPAPSWLAACRPWVRAAHVTHVTPGFLARHGLRALALDMDNTLVRWHSLDVPPEVDEWVEALHAASVGMCIVSNSHSPRRVRRLAERLRISWVPSGGKPSIRGFRRAMAALGSTPGQTAVLGDQLLTDILGGNRAGLRTVLVDPICDYEFIGTRLLNRPLERWLLAQLARLSPVPYIGATTHGRVLAANAEEMPEASLAAAPILPSSRKGAS